MPALNKAISLLVASATLSASSWGVGFGLAEQSVVGAGYGFAGLAANPEDASTIFFNPAGLAFLKRREVIIAMHAIDVSAKFLDAGSTSPAGPLFPLTGNDGGNPIGLNWVPNLYLASPWTPNLSFGLGIGAPFGLKTKYGSEWLGRYYATTSDLKTMNINPSVALQTGSAGSFGAGLDFQYLRAELDNALDFGAACFGSPFGPDNCAGAGILPQGRDGRVSIKGDSWSIGWNFGWMIPLGEGSFVGASYRSPMKHRISGDARFSLPAFAAPFSAIAAGIGDTGAKADITLPGSMSISVKLQMSPRLFVLGDVTRTYWSRLQELRIRFDDGSADAVTPLHWKDVTRSAIGVGYDLSASIRLRGGISHEPSTVPDRYRTPRVPDNDQTFVGGGIGYRLSAAHAVDFSYGHVFVKNAPVDLSVAGSGTLKGTYKVSAEIFSLQYRGTF